MIYVLKLLWLKNCLDINLFFASFTHIEWNISAKEQIFKLDWKVFQLITLRLRISFVLVHNQWNTLKPVKSTFENLQFTKDFKHYFKITIFFLPFIAYFQKWYLTKTFELRIKAMFCNYLELENKIIYSLLIFFFNSSYYFILFYSWTLILFFWTIFLHRYLYLSNKLNYTLFKLYQFI